MWTCVFVFYIGFSVALAIELELYGHNDWVPVNSDIVYNQIKHGIHPRLTKAEDVQAINADVNFISQHREYEDMKDKQDNIEEDNDRFSKRRNTIIDSLKTEPTARFENAFTPILPPVNNQKTDLKRRSKKLADIDSHVLYNYILLPKDDKPKNFRKFDKDLSKDNLHAYEVTENIDIEDGKQETKDIGYEYRRPMKQNFTNDLIKHLSKYNINSNDNLQNYALSRRSKAENHLKQNHLRKPFQIPASNSLNHLPVDPLLAVFLSNYGHYIQGQYGIANNYNNLYGYLASNNIHNNRPFGWYKLFSDTDSSNK